MWLFFIFLVIKLCESERVVRQVDLKGEVDIRMCNPVRDLGLKFSRANNITNLGGLQIYPEWITPDERQYEPLQNYTWSYNMSRVIRKNGQEVEEYMEIPSNWLHETQKYALLLEIPPYGLSPGYYMVYPRGVLKNPNDKLKPVKKKECHLFFLSVPPVAIISGGTYRTVSSGKDVFLNGRQSYDDSTKQKSHENLDFYWKCTQEKQPPTFCAQEPVSTRRTLPIPSQFVQEGDSFTVTLTVTTKYIEEVNRNSSYIQDIKVVHDAANLEITCEKNCPPVSDMSNYKYATFLRVSCISNCHEIKTQNYEWSVERDDDPDYVFDYRRNTQFGRTGDKFFVFKNTFRPGGYSASVKLTDASVRAGEAMLTLNFPEPPSVKNCSIQPSTGQSLVTFFTLSCDQSPSNSSNRYELIARGADGEKTIMDGSFPLVFEYQFSLPPSDTYSYFAKISFGRGPPIEVKLEAEVKSTESSVDVLESFYDGGKYEASIPSLLSSANSTTKEKGIRMFHSLVDQIVSTEGDSRVKKFVEELKYKAVDDMLKAPITSNTEVVQIADSIASLMKHNEAPASDPLLTKFSTTICKKIISKHVDMIRSERYPLDFADEAGKVSKSLGRCLETNTNPNFEVMAPIGRNITTEKTVARDEFIEENYEDYHDFNEDYYKHLEYLKEATHNIFNASSMSAKAVAMTTAVGEKFVEIFGKNSATVVAKDTGERLFKSRVSSQGVVLVPSPDIDDETHSFDILMSTWSKDILWWNRAKIRVSTDIVNVQFWHSTCKRQITNFDEPAQLIFTIKEDIDFEMIKVEDSFLVPRQYRDLDGDDLSRTIKVWRTVVPKGQTLRVQFTDLLQEDALDVVVTKFSFPTSEDFDNSTLVTMTENTFLTFTSDYDFDVWWYIGILANKRSVEDNSLRTISYSMGTTITCCIRWTEAESLWEPTCTSVVVTDDNIIRCECTHFSVIAGHLQNIEVQLQEVVPTDLEMVLHATNVIFIVVASTFGIYCLLLLCATRKIKNEVFFLADNNMKHRFAYLIETKTGRGFHSGTTSNVTITLVGDKSSSDPHVLNYPDPELRLLQKFGHDSFILTTEHHLGNLVQIELWFDCLGPSPDWFCKNITVYDMQKYSKWYFKVNKRLAVLKGKAYVQLLPAKKNLLVKYSGRYHTWCLWYVEENFGYVKKVTVLLSSTLVIYVLALVCYGVPEFELRDGFDVDYKIDVGVVLTACVSSFPTFLAHMVVIWCFRFSEHKQIVTRICWILVTSVIFTSMVLLVVLGFWVPYYKSLMWLTSSMVGVTLHAVLYENISALLQSICCKLETRLGLQTKFQTIWRATESQRRILYRHFGDKLLKPYFEHLYRPLEVSKIEEKRMIVAHRRHVISELEDLVMFGMYIVILYIVVLANKDNLIVRGKTEMEEIMGGVHTRTLGFPGIGSIHDFYDYVNGTLILALQPITWYGNYVMSEPALMTDATNKFIGIARFRQHRTKPKACVVPESMRFLQNSCVPEFSLFRAQTGVFGYAREAGVAYLTYDRLRNIWRYSSDWETGSLATIGEFATYSGGGYVAYLGRTLYNSYANFLGIFEKSWIDLKSRSIFVEFLTYNVNYNVFNSVKLRYEQSASGYTFKYVEVYAARMLFVDSKVRRMTAFSLFLFVLWVAMLFLKQSIGAIRKIRTFYKDVWLLVDFVIIGMSISCIALFLFRTIMIKSYLDKLETIKHNEFLNYFYLFYLEDFLAVFAAVLVCIATIRLWRFLRFGMMFRILERTLSMAAVPLLSVTFCYIVFVMAFAVTVFVLSNYSFERINTFVRLTRFLVTMIFGESDDDISAKHTVVSFYIALYGLLVNVVLVIFVAVIIMSYAEAQAEFSAEADAYNIKDYVQEQIRYIPRFIRYKYLRLKGGEEIKSRLEAKDDTFMSLNSFSVDKDRMRAMYCVTQCVIRNIKRPPYFSDYDTKLMLKLCQAFFAHSETEADVFFKGRIKGKKITLVDEKKISKIARIVDVLLQKPPSDTSLEVTKEVVLQRQCAKIIRQNLNTLRNCSLKLKLVLGKIDSELNL